MKPRNQAEYRSQYLTKWKDKSPEITQQLLCDLFEYDPKSGVVSAKKGFQGRSAGPVGSIVDVGGEKKYYRVKICYQGHMLHRIIWMMQMGYWPEQVDHINGDGLDNRWGNLREVDAQGNARNRAVSTRNKTGVTGVRWRPEYKRWVSSIMVDGKHIHLYWGYDFFEAVCRRKSAENKYGFHPNHGMR